MSAVLIWAPIATTFTGIFLMVGIAIKTQSKVTENIDRLEEKYVAQGVCDERSKRIEEKMDSGIVQIKELIQNNGLH